MDVKSLETSIQEMQKNFEEFKKLHTDSETDRAHKLEGVEKCVSDLEETVKTVQAKVARQNQASQANEEGLKFLHNLNIARYKMGKGELLASDMDGYAHALAKLMRAKMDKDRLTEVERKALQEGVDSTGGYFVVPQMSQSFIVKDFETSPMEQFANIETTSSDRFGYWVDFDEFDAGYTSELKERAITDNAKLGKLFIDVHTVYLKIPVSNELLEDAGTDINSWVLRKANEKEMRVRNANYINGDGKGEEQGILTPESVVGSEGKFGQVERLITNANNALDYNDLIDLFAALNDTYHDNAALLMSRQLFFKELIKLKDTQGRYIVDIFARDGIPNTLAGYRIGFMQNMAKDLSVANQDLIAFGDIRQAYTIVKRRGMSLLADPYSLDGGVLMKFDSRGGAGVTNTQAYKILRRKA